jgi:hypothetical protein
MSNRKMKQERIKKQAQRKENTQNKIKSNMAIYKRQKLSSP